MDDDNGDVFEFTYGANAASAVRGSISEETSCNNAHINVEGFKEISVGISCDHQSIDSLEKEDQLDLLDVVIVALTAMREQKVNGKPRFRSKIRA
jgi:hypothetical protein